MKKKPGSAGSTTPRRRWFVWGRLRTRALKGRKALRGVGYVVYPLTWTLGGSGLTDRAPPALHRRVRGQNVAVRDFQALQGHGHDHVLPVLLGDAAEFLPLSGRVRFDSNRSGKL